MYWLELRIPPVILLALCAIFMWITALFYPSLTVNPNYSHAVILLSLLLLMLGSGFVLLAIFWFYRAGTTVNPLRPEQTTSLVVTGVYSYSRNPVYLGLAMILLSWAIYLSNMLSLLFVIVFILAMNRFQIEPEEKILYKLFGDQYKQYQNKVRRWI
ncbi:MAG: isoprenylcysteine carboxylmethyltransferase family protein [Nitrosomonas sp.]|nr:isoprenylcysteine carboxylmethyltransferase family protein [Nitrosomonas sp.]